MTVATWLADRDAGGALFWKAVVDPVARNWEQQFQGTAAREFVREELRVIEAVRGATKALPDWRRVTAEIEKVLEERTGDWRAGFIPLFQAELEAFFEGWAAELGVDFRLVNQHVTEFIDGYAYQFVERHQGVTREALAELTAQAYREGWDVLRFIGDAGSGLRELYSGWSKLRAEMIARTETIRVENAGATAAYLDAGIAEMEWYTAVDERVCAFCGALHQKTWRTGAALFEKGDQFRVGDAVLNLNYEAVRWPPLHVFCRCTVLPVMGR